MKSKKIIQLVVLGVFILILSSFKNETKIALINQDTKTIIATFDGAEAYGYNFIVSNVDDEESTITFQNADDEVLEAFDLASEALIGTTMKVTYTAVTEIEADEDGFENEIEVLTITKLEQIEN